MDWTYLIDVDARTVHLLIVVFSMAIIVFHAVKQDRTIRSLRNLLENSQAEHAESLRIFSTATNALAEACPIEKLDGEWQWQKAVRYINALKAELAHCGSGLYPEQIAASHLQIQHFLKLVEDAFPYPEGFEGRHHLTLNRKTGELELGIWMRSSKPNTSRCHTVRFFGKAELLDEKLVEDLKAFALKNSAT